MCEVQLAWASNYAFRVDTCIVCKCHDPIRLMVHYRSELISLWSEWSCAYTRKKWVTIKRQNVFFWTKSDIVAEVSGHKWSIYTMLHYIVSCSHVRFIDYNELCCNIDSHVRIVLNPSTWASIHPYHTWSHNLDKVRHAHVRDIILQASCVYNMANTFF